MNELLHDDELLIRYLDGDLSDQEKSRLEERLQKENRLREKLTDLHVATEAVKQYGTASQVAAVHASMMDELKSDKKLIRSIGFRRTVRLTMAIAASLLVVAIGIGVYFSQQVTAEKLYDEAFVDFQISASRGNEAELTAIEKSYQAKDYAAVIQATRSLELDAKDSLLIGLSYLQTGKQEQAIGILFQLVNRENQFQQDAEFYLALAYLNIKQVQKAVPLVEKIHGNRYHLYHERFDAAFVENLKEVSKK